jgi:hypothetical protein
MQTSFMHPPFGFALFYLRSVAPRESFVDRVTGRRTDGVTTGQIYWGAVPFVVIQVAMIAVTIAFPAMVMHYKGGELKLDTSKMRIETPRGSAAPAGSPNFKAAPPNFGGPAPTGQPGFKVTPPPSFGAPAPKPSTPPPPNFGAPPAK